MEEAIMHETPDVLSDRTSLPLYGDRIWTKPPCPERFISKETHDSGKIRSRRVTPVIFLALSYPPAVRSGRPEYLRPYPLHSPSAWPLHQHDELD